MSTVSKMLYFFDSRVFRSQNLSPACRIRAGFNRARLCRLRAGGCRWDRQMSTGQDADDGNAIMQKRGILPWPRVYSIQPRDFRALCNQRQHRVERGRRNLRHEANVCTCARELHTEISADRAGAVDTDLHEILRMRVAEISAQTTRGFERKLKATAIAADAEGAGSSGCGDRSRRLVVERSRDVADADDADQAIVLEHRQMADVVLVHEMANMFERIGRDAGNQLLH